MSMDVGEIQTLRAKLMGDASPP